MIGDFRSPRMLLIVATLAALLVVPDWPLRHPTDPSYWGVVAFACVVVVLLVRSPGRWSPGTANRRVIVAFLVGLPVIYVADWVRFGGSVPELAVQLAGLVVWLVVAVRARTDDGVLWLGCAAHAIWDAAHYGRVGFVPDWYVAACMAADIGLAAFVLLRLREASSSGP